MKRVSTLALCAALLLAVGRRAGPHRRRADKPRIAVLEFKNKADNQWWYHGGAEAAQDVFVTELVKSGKFRVVEREQLEALMQEKNLALSGDVDPKTAVQDRQAPRRQLPADRRGDRVRQHRTCGGGGGGVLRRQEEVRGGDERPPDRHQHRRDRLGRRGAGRGEPASRCRSSASAAASTTTGCSTRS